MDTSAYLYAHWRALALPASPDWVEATFVLLQKKHAEKHRHYHNFEHLETMFRLFDAHRLRLEDPETVALAIFFHDSVYSVTRKDNEARSAGLAVKTLSAIGYAPERAERIRTLILATRDHALPDDAPADLAWLLDFDLAILGAPAAEYDAYTQKIRREYRIYPDILYRPGRRKAMEHFLEHPHIYHTDFFREHFENAARENLRREIAALTA
jgi:predicted metal-dependent HD superfamily phosphohydrolase